MSQPGHIDSGKEGSNTASIWEASSLIGSKTDSCQSGPGLFTFRRGGGSAATSTRSAAAGSWSPTSELGGDQSIADGLLSLRAYWRAGEEDVANVRAAKSAKDDPEQARARYIEQLQAERPAEHRPASQEERMDVVRVDIDQEVNKCARCMME